MDSNTMLAAVRPLLEKRVGRFAGLIQSATDLHQPVPGRTWTVQQTAAHLAVSMSLYDELANGAPSPYRSLAPDACAAVSEQRLADVPEDDPVKLARLVIEAADRFLDTTANRPGDHPVTFHCDEPFNLAGLACVLLGEAVLHGYDIAVALRQPWWIEADEALLILAGSAPLYHLIVDPQRTRGLDVAVSINLRGGDGELVARFCGGRFAFEAPGDPVDATLSADPVAFLMVGAGRLDRWAPLALGLLEVGGKQPDLAVAFPDFFAYP